MHIWLSKVWIDKGIESSQFSRLTFNKDHSFNPTLFFKSKELSQNQLIPDLQPTEPSSYPKQQTAIQT